MHFFGRRYYDSQNGIWLIQDPLGLQAGPNLYAYVRNNPMTVFDLYGLEEVAERQRGGFFDRVADFGWDIYDFCRDCAGTLFGVCEAQSSSQNESSSIGDFKSTLGGISHGIIDFMVGSLHDLQTASVYIGSAELEMSLEERAQMHTAVE